MMILTIFVSDSDSNEALQEETYEEDESEEEVVTHFPQEENRQEDESEEEVATHVRQGTIKSYRFTHINFSTYQFDYLPNDSTDTYRKYSKNIHKSSQ